MLLDVDTSTRSCSSRDPAASIRFNSRLTDDIEKRMGIERGYGVRTKFPGTVRKVCVPHQEI